MSLREAAEETDEGTPLLKRYKMTWKLKDR
jgi:hypothetical protein